VESIALQLPDEGSFRPVEDGLSSADPLAWPGYGDELSAAAQRSGRDESVVAGPCTIGTHEVELALFEFSFIGGSIGEVAGTRLANSLQRAGARRVPFVLRTATGGARMQEGMRSLVQMPKVVAARSGFTGARTPFICVFGNPTTGGVLASLAALADLTVAEADATIGFVGPRVAQRFTGQPLSDTSHTAPSAFTHGLVDEMVTSADVRSYLVTALDTLAADAPRDDVGTSPLDTEPRDHDAWDAVQSARDPGRPHAPDLARLIADGSFVELRGDRAGQDDPALTCGLARVGGRRVVMMALEREHAPGPAAYRKAVRCIGIAGRLGVPVVALIDMRGADPSSASEAGGIAWAIASLLDAMLSAPVPILSVVTGEAAGAGAIAFAAADRLIAYQDSIFSVIGPESAAEILWRDVRRAPDAAKTLNPTAHGLLDLGVADEIAPGPLEPAGLKSLIAARLAQMQGADLPPERLERWRNA
jgi:acetyl-CoA carboxylase beta subunit/acetyl-CoA carboxylase alpha subunit